MQAPQLHELLKGATDLELLLLEFPTDEIWAQIDLTTVFGTFRWRALRSLTISGVRSTEDELLEFLTRHATTLREVKFTFAWLKSGSWVTAAQRMKDSLCLTDAHFDISIGTEDGVETWWPDEVYTWTRDLEDPGMIVCKKLEDCLNFFICRGDERDKNPLENIELHPLDINGKLRREAVDQ